MDEKSLIKKYQKEISSLKQELQQLKRGMMEKPYVGGPAQEDLVNLKLQMEAGQMKLQSRLEEEEHDKAALMGRIQKLTKLILVSTKNSMPSSIPEKTGNRRRHSFGEDELAYLPDRKREYMIDDDVASFDSEISADGRCDVASLDKLVKDYKTDRRRGMLGWFKLKKHENLVGSSPSSNSEVSTSVSPTSGSKSIQRVMVNETKDGNRKSICVRGVDSSVDDLLPQTTQAGDIFSATVGFRRLPPSGTTIADQMDLLREQVKMIAGEVAFNNSSLKRLSEQAASNPEDLKVKEQMKRLKQENNEKKRHIWVLEQRMLESAEMSQHTSNSNEMTQALSKLASQLNEKTFELEIKSADNRILQEQLQMKISENTEMQETILLLRRQLDSLTQKSSGNRQLTANSDTGTLNSFSGELFEKKTEGYVRIGLYEENCVDDNTPTSVMSLNRVFSQDYSKECNGDTFLNSQVLLQAAEIEGLKQEKVRLTEEKDGVEIQSQKLAEESLYAKELAAAAAVELRNLAEEVTKLSYQNAKLTSNLAAAKEARCRSNCSHRSSSSDMKQRYDVRMRKQEDKSLVEARYQREASLETVLVERERIEGEFRMKLDKAKQREEEMENELANMWVLVAKLRKSGDMSPKENLESSTLHTKAQNGIFVCNGNSANLLKDDQICDNMNEVSTLDELRASFRDERRRCKELESIISGLKGHNVIGLDIADLEELQTLHVEAITKICHAKYSNQVL